MRITPCAFIRPPKARAVEVACAPDAHRQALPGLPGTSFVRVLAAGPDPEAIRGALQHLMLAGALEVDHHPRMFIYRAVHEGRRWMGLVCAVDTRDLVPLIYESATPEEIHEAEAARRAIGAQLNPALVRVQPSEEAAYLFVTDMNERPAYHFRSHDDSTHSAWHVHKPDLYTKLFTEVTPLEVLHGGAHLMTAHLAGVPALAILSADVDSTLAAGGLAPRAGLFVGAPRDA